MYRPEFFRVVPLLLVIFAGGFLTGRWTAPIPEPFRDPPARAEYSDVQRMIDVNLARFARMVPLDTEQMHRIRPKFEALAKAISAFPEATRDRLAVFQNQIPGVREELRPDQHPAFDEYVRQTVRRFEQRITAAGR